MKLKLSAILPTMPSTSTKRARAEKPSVSHKKQKNSRTSTSTKIAHEKVVSLNELTWQPVALPERLEDAEGFFGLEEIDDVEVVRDSTHGIVQYRVGKVH